MKNVAEQEAEIGSRAYQIIATWVSMTLEKQLFEASDY